MAAIPGQDPTLVAAPNGAPLTIIPASYTKASVQGACLVDPSGNVIAVTLADANTTQVTKLDGQFNQLWSKALPNFRIENKCPAAVDDSGNVFVGGKVANKNASIAQFLPDGTPGWTTSLGNNDEVDLVATGADNTIFAVGTGDQIPNQPPGGAGFALQYGPAGSLLQSIQETLITGQLGGSLQVDPAGNMTFLGNIVITKLGPTFGTIWNISGPLALAVSPDGSGIYDWTNNPIDSIEKRDPATGALLWRRGFATQTATLNAVEGQTWTGQFSGTPILLASNDALYLAGTYGNAYKNGSSPIPNTSPGYVARLDATGQQVWFRQFRAMSSSTTPATAVMDLGVFSLALTEQGKLLVAGSSSGNGRAAFFLNAADGTGP